MASIIIELGDVDDAVIADVCARIRRTDLGTPLPDFDMRSSDSPAAFREDAEASLRSWWEEDIPTTSDILRGNETSHTYARGMLDLLMSVFPYAGGEDWDVSRIDVWTLLFPELVPKTFDEIAELQGWNADSQNTILRNYIRSDKMVTLDEFAQHVADVENGKV